MPYFLIKSGYIHDFILVVMVLEFSWPALKHDTKRVLDMTSLYCYEHTYTDYVTCLQHG